VCGGEARDGTTHFYCCATAYIIHRGVNLTHPKPSVPKLNYLRWPLRV
jgi:hypothetical protein